MRTIEVSDGLAERYEALPPGQRAFVEQALEREIERLARTKRWEETAAELWAAGPLDVPEAEIDQEIRAGVAEARTRVGVPIPA